MVKGPSVLKVAGLYLFSVFLLTYYGIEVCPYLDDLDPLYLARIFAGGFLIAGIARYTIFRRIEVKETASSEPINLQKPWQYLTVDLGCWILAAALISVWRV